LSGISQTSDRDIVDLLRQTGSMCVSELAEATDVTATAVRQRLSRLMEQGIVGRRTLRSGRGRPSHRYELTEKGHRQSGSNFDDLAMMLWQEIRSITEPSIRRGLIARLGKRMAGLYADRIKGDTVGDRMQAVAEVFAERSVPLAVEIVRTPAAPEKTPAGILAAERAATETAAAVARPAAKESQLEVLDITPARRRPAAGESAVLTVWACPYPELAEVDRGICAMERMMFAELLSQDVRLTACRLDGDPCCRFQTGPLAVSNPVASG
jgi:predicted ArsR family transcriptional regulator